MKIGGGTRGHARSDDLRRDHARAWRRVQQAANESLATRLRIRETLAGKMRDGQPMGAGRPYGFETGGLVQSPEEVAVVREIAQRVLAGEPLQHLAAELNERGLTTRPGQRGGRGEPPRGCSGGHRYGGLVEHHGQIVGTMRASRCWIATRTTPCRRCSRRVVAGGDPPGGSR